MKIPSNFMGKNIVTLFNSSDKPSGMTPSAARSTSAHWHPGAAPSSLKAPKNSVFQRFLRGGFK